MFFMKTEKGLNQDILTITMKIKDNFPVSVKYISEIPVKLVPADEPGESINSLINYFDSLDSTLKRYTEKIQELRNINDKMLA